MKIQWKNGVDIWEWENSNIEDFWKTTMEDEKMIKPGVYKENNYMSSHEPYVGPRPTNVYTIPHGVIIDVSKHPDLVRELSSIAKANPTTKSNKPISWIPSIKKVYSHDPYTIVLWDDKTKTIVKAQDGEVYDPEKGLAMAIAKRALGNNGSYYEVFKRYLIWPEEVEMLEKEDSSND